jgi:hypothetical protein
LALLDRADYLVPVWLPGGHKTGHEWACGSLRGGAGGSCSINLNTGAWADFSSDERGGDLVSLYAAIHGLTMGKAAVQVARDEGLEDVAGVPTFFAHVGTDLEIFPTPGDSYTGEITYYAKITALAADGDTNWLLAAAPDMYLYAALMHSAPYLRDDPRIAVWAGLYSQAAGELAQQSEQARFGGPLRMRVK